jgi:hypothetical protein
LIAANIKTKAAISAKRGPQMPYANAKNIGANEKVTGKIKNAKTANPPLKAYEICCNISTKL